MFGKGLRVVSVCTGSEESGRREVRGRPPAEDGREETSVQQHVRREETYRGRDGGLYDETQERRRSHGLLPVLGLN